MDNQCMDLNEVAIFIKVVQTGSFSEAAKQLQMPKSTVSMKISNLERTLNTTLINRTTRKLNITPEGEAFYNRSLQGLELINSAEDELSSLKGEPQGLLRITAPLDLGNSILPQIVADYAKKYPKVIVDVILTDRRVDLLSEKVDLAIRAGNLKDSTLIAKKLGAAYFAPFASPKYIKQYGEPQHPRDLVKHRLLHFQPLGTNEWRLAGPKGTLDVPVTGKMILNSLLMIKSMTLIGEGIALLPTYYCIQEVKAGKLVRILPEWRTPLQNVHFVYPSQKFVKPKLKAFIEMATEPLKENFFDFEI